MHYEDRMLFFCSPFPIIKKNWLMIFHFSRQSETLLKMDFAKFIKTPMANWPCRCFGIIPKACIFMTLPLDKQELKRVTQITTKSS